MSLHLPHRENESKIHVSMVLRSGKQQASCKSAKTANYLSWFKYGKLYAFEEVPTHLQTNSFIRHGYRYNLSWSQCLRSFFFFHNETMNVWTHFIGFVLFVFYFLRDFIVSRHHQNLFSSSNLDDYLMLLFYVLCIICCMIASTTLHLFSGCTVHVYNSCMQLDLLGIALATLASFFIGLHLLFKCHFYTRVFYQLAIISLIVIVVKHHLSNRDDTIDSTGFIAVTLAGFVPLFHWIYIHEYSANISYFFINIIVFYLIFGTGVLFFRTKVPERLAPGYFDYVGASHQLWHLFSLLAFYWWYSHSVELIQHHQTYACTEVFSTIGKVH